VFLKGAINFYGKKVLVCDYPGFTTQEKVSKRFIILFSMAIGVCDLCNTHYDKVAKIISNIGK